MYLLGSAERHRVPQRAAHYTGDSLSVNTFLRFFFKSLKTASGGALRMTPEGRKEPLFPREYAVLAESSQLGHAHRTKVHPPVFRGAGAIFLAETRRFSVAAGPPVFELLTTRQSCESSKLVTPEFRRIQSVPEIVFQIRQRLERTLVILRSGPGPKQRPPA